MRFRHPSIQAIQGDVPFIFHRAHLPRWLLIAGTLGAVLAVCTPHIPLTVNHQLPPIPNLALVLDLSGSMEAADWPDDAPLPPGEHTPKMIPPTRLVTAKENIRKLLALRPDSQVALIAFAHRPYLICPLMSNARILEERLEILSPEDFEDGTAIGDAIALAQRTLQAATTGPKVIFLFSDGVDHSENEQAPVFAAQHAMQENIRIYTVGIGGNRAYHPIATDTGIDWRPVGEVLDERQLKEMAESTGGRYFKANDSKALSMVFEFLSAEVGNLAQSLPKTQDVSLRPVLLLISMSCILLSLVARLLVKSLS